MAAKHKSSKPAAAKAPAAKTSPAKAPPAKAPTVKTPADKVSAAKSSPAKAPAAKAARPAKVVKPHVAKTPSAKTPVAKPKAAAKAIKRPAAPQAETIPAPLAAQPLPPTADESPTLVEAWYVTFDPLPSQFHRTMPQSGSAAIAFDTFAEAKARAIDHLVELIEEAEHRLHLLRRASTREEYPH